VGATLTGLFYDHLGPRFAAALFQERDEAFAWLGRTDTTRVAREVAGILEAARGTPALVRRLRAHLTTAPGRPDLPRAARATGVAARSLQRHLREAGTSFRAEVDRARIALAERMLVGGDAKIEAVARRSGFTSASHLSRTFRRATGETPAEFRKRRRVLPD
ncbi:MAG TPA: AraC family transcriptional regulator, partial [Polyangiaceae bacterium]